METALLIIDIVKAYGAIGAVVAVLFLVFGIDRIDHSAHRALAFRPLLIPGLVVLWPLVLGRWFVLERRRS